MVWPPAIRLVNMSITSLSMWVSRPTSARLTVRGDAAEQQRSEGEKAEGLHDFG